MTLLSIVVPCYNEEEGLHELFFQLRSTIKNLNQQYSIEIIFVDDGSKDATLEKLLKFKKQYSKNVSIKVLRHKVNKNLGGVLKTAFKETKGDLVATVDADCTYHLSNIPKMLKEMDSKTDIITASPYHPKGSFTASGYRIFLSKATSKIYGALTGSKIYTFTALFRIYRKRVIENILIESDSFLAVTEILVKALQKGYNIKEFPTRLEARKFGQSKMRLLSTICMHLRLMSKLMFKP